MGHNDVVSVGGVLHGLFLCRFPIVNDFIPKCRQSFLHAVMVVLQFKPMWQIACCREAAPCCRRRSGSKASVLVLVQKQRQHAGTMLPIGRSMGEESAGVIQMIDTILNDVEKENQVLELKEKDAQEDHEKFMEDAKARRAEEIFDNFKRG